MKHWLKYDVIDIKKTREFYKEITKDPRPLLICSNHLTYIDSILIIWMFGHPLWYLTHLDKISWNLPNAKYAKNPFFRFVGYFGKCMFIERKGSLAHSNKVLEQAISILKREQVLTIFPEGRRSKTGRFETDKLVFGPGRVFSEVNDCRVLCVYVRSNKQNGASSLPPKNSVFKPLFRFITPETSKSGYEGYKEIVSQIGASIKELEVQHFSL